MKALLSQNCRCRSTFLSSPARSIESLATSKDPSSSNGEEKHLRFGPVDPLLLFTNYTKSRHYTIRSTKICHTQLVKNLLLQDTFNSNLLMHCYGKCSVMADALKLFDEIPHPNVISWNIMISGYNQDCSFLDSWGLFCKMHRWGFHPDEFTYGSIFSACTALHAPFLGMQVYSLTLKNGSFTNGYVRAGLIDLFAKTYNFEDALRVFDDMWCEKVVCWNAAISGAVKNGEDGVAVDLFQRMCRSSLLPNSFTFSSVLSAFAGLEDFESGKRVQGLVTKCISSNDNFVSTSLIDLYAKCGDMDGAMKIFRQMPFPNVVSWTSIISGFVQNNDSISALLQFREMRISGEEINNYTVTSLLATCVNPTLIKIAGQIHSWIVKSGFQSDPSVADGLVNMYSKLGDIRSCELMYKQMEISKNISTWATMITACSQHKNSTRAIQLFKKMLLEGLRPDKACISSLLSAIATLELGIQVHSHVIKSGLVIDVFVSSSLFTMYSKCGSLEESYEIFEQIHEKDDVSWASMMVGFVEHGRPVEAVQLFRRMLGEGYEPEETTFNTILTALCSLQLLNEGKEIHASALRLGLFDKVVVRSGLVIMYLKCGQLMSARRVFDLLPERDDFAYCSLISGYAKNGYIEEAISLFCGMQRSGLAIDFSCLSSALGAITHLNKVGVAKQLHSYITKVGLDTDASVGSSLVIMYSKCGSIYDCTKAFDQVETPDLICWTVMITAYAQHGKAEEALRIFNLMKENNVRPDAVSFVAVLSACSHSGLVEEGYFHFNSMAKDYAIEPNCYHYACMVDLLGRGGRLIEAERFINRMPIKPNALVWGTLLAACKVHGDIELGRFAAKKVVELEPSDTGAYVSLSNIHAHMGQWEEVLNIRTLMEGTGANKEPGWSAV